MEEMKNDPLKAIWAYAGPTMTMPIITADYLKGITVRPDGVDSSIWKKAKIYRNGIHTTVKWGDGTITRVKLTEGEEGNDVDAFLNALGKKLFGSRTALKKFVEQNTVVQKKKERKAKVVEGTDKYGQEVHEGDAIFLDPKIFVDGNNGLIIKVTWESGERMSARWADCRYKCDKSDIVKVKTGPPYSVGDYVVFRNPKENCLVHMNAWTSHMTADTPLMIEKVEGVNLLCSDGCVYESIWVRGLDT